MQKNNFSWLLLALLVLLIGLPVADELESLSRPVVRALLFSCLLMIGNWSLRGSGAAHSVALGFAFVGIATSILAVNLSSNVFLYVSFLAVFGFLLIAISFTLKQVVRGTEISTNRLVGAVCVYLLLGMIWAVAYTMLDMISPGSFQGFAQLEDRGWASEWLYFSFVTMTTLGYGDILPVSAPARMLAYLQAVFGQFYIAILVAGLVSAYITNRSKEGD